LSSAEERSGRRASLASVSPQRVNVPVQGPKLDDIEVQNGGEQDLGVLLGRVYVGTGHGPCEADLSGRVPKSEFELRH